MVHIAKGSGERRVEIPAIGAKYVAMYIVTHTPDTEAELNSHNVNLTSEDADTYGCEVTCTNTVNGFVEMNRLELDVVICSK